ncbi:MAG: flagellar hook-associated protein FlgL [Fimbriimonadaceae bacterium]
MRISFHHQYDTYLGDLGRAQEAYIGAQRQVSSGRRINSIGDDPVGTQSAISMRSLRSTLAQFGSNIGSADVSLKSSEASLTEMQTLVRRAHELASQASNTSTSQEARNGMITEIAEVQKRILGLSNTQLPNGTYIFGGQNNGSAPFTAVGSVLTYNGDANNVLVEIGPNEQISATLPAEKMVKDLWARLESLKSNLQSGNVSALGNIDMDELKKSEADILLARGTIGGKLKTLEETRNTLTRRTDELTEQISNVEDVDMSEAIMNYKLAETAYQAAMQSVSMSSQLSLMDFLR